MTMPRRVDDFSFFDCSSPFCFFVIEFHTGSVDDLSFFEYVCPFDGVGLAGFKSRANASLLA